MITKEEIEILKNSNNDTQKKIDFEKAMTKFKTESIAATERFENVIDSSFRNRIKYNRENNECKKNVIVSFRTENIFQIAALSHIIKKYQNAGFKVFPMKSRLYEKRPYPPRENIDRLERMVTNTTYSNYERDFVRTNEDLNEIVAIYDEIIRRFSNFDDCYKKIIKGNRDQRDQFDLFRFGFNWNDDENTIFEKVKFIDILNGYPLYVFEDYLEGDLSKIGRNQVLEFSLE